jgi:hypothetical protein
LWRDTSEIDFVRQAIRHAKIDTTSHYLEELSEKKIKLKMDKVRSPEDLFIDVD